ncbi:MAG: hypothetical protein IH989_07030 [Planctomycetes bacterium]|nr:hypothetical protein [Planctomycetota bacterium]
MALSVGLIGGSRSDAALLYNVDFGTPPHRLGQAPVIDLGSAPRAGPTMVSHTPPIVVAKLGALDAQPVAFAVDTTGWLSQLEFRLTGARGFPTSYPAYFVEFDVLVAFVDEPNTHFTVFFDAPTVRPIRFLANRSIHAEVSGVGGYSVRIGTYELGVPVAVAVGVDLARQRWIIWLDGVLAFSGAFPLEAGAELRSIRTSLTDFEPYGALAAIDNVWVVGGQHGDLNCDGAFNGGDIDPFFFALGDPAGYGAAFPECSLSFADMSGDGLVNGADIDPFFACLGGGACP